MSLQCVGDIRAFNKHGAVNQLAEMLAIASSQSVKDVKITHLCRPFLHSEAKCNTKCNIFFFFISLANRPCWLAMPYYKAKFSTKSYYKANFLSDCQSILIINNSQSMFIFVINLWGADTNDEKLRKDMYGVERQTMRYKVALSFWACPISHTFSLYTFPPVMTYFLYLSQW